MLKVGDVLNPEVVTIDARAPLDRARSIMQKYGIGSLVVLEEGKLDGILYLEDVLLYRNVNIDLWVKGLARVPLITYPDEPLRKLFDRMKLTDSKYAVTEDASGIVSLTDMVGAVEGDDTPVKEVMTREVITCKTWESVDSVIRRMHTFKLTGLPVLRGRKPVGFVTLKDLLKHRNAKKVKDVMKPLISVPSTARMSEVVELMKKHSIGRVPVVDGVRLYGIVDRWDVLDRYLR